MRTIDVFDLDRIDLGAEERAAYQRGDMLLAAALGALLDTQESSAAELKAEQDARDEAERLADAKDDDLTALQEKVKDALDELYEMLETHGNRSAKILKARIVEMSAELGL